MNVGGMKELPAEYRHKAFISHQGPSVHSRHYAAHVRIGADWVLFNEKVVGKVWKSSRNWRICRTFEKI